MDIKCPECGYEFEDYVESDDEVIVCERCGVEAKASEATKKKLYPHAKSSSWQV